LNKSENEEENAKEAEAGVAKLTLDRPPTGASSKSSQEKQATDDDLRSLRRKHKGESEAASPPARSPQVEEDPGRKRSNSNPTPYVPPTSQSASSKVDHSVSNKDENRRSSKIPQPLPTSTRPPTAPSRDEQVQGTAINNNRLSLQVKRSGATNLAALPSTGSSKSESNPRLSISSNISSTQSEARGTRSPSRRTASPQRTTLAASPSRLDSSRRPGTGVASDVASDSRVPTTQSTVSSTARSGPMMNYQWHGAENIDDVDTFTESPRTSPQHSSLQDLAIRVVVRKRPLSRSELNRGERDVLEILPSGRVSVHEPKTKVDLTKIVETQAFMYDDAFDCDDDNDIIYSRTIKPLVMNVFGGGKATCFAYGQTGSGKTFTMMGDASSNDPKKLGLYVHAARDIFSVLQRPEYSTYQAFVSCFEIYGGKLFDLLHDRGLVKCLEDSKQQVQILGLTEHRVTTVDSLIELMRVAHNVRSTGATGANAESSRSHLIMQIEIKKLPTATATSTTNRRATNSFQRQFKEQPVKLVVVGKLSFIDLAGSERGKDTTDNSKQTRMEGAEINTSLLALKEVIRSLNRQHGHTPFRGSKLTQVLKDSFVGENTRTCMVACVSPSHLNCEHTLNTLRYADRVKEHQVSASGGIVPAGGSDNDLTYPNESSSSPEPVIDYPYPAQVQIAPPPPAIPASISRTNSSNGRMISASTGSSKSGSVAPQMRNSPPPPYEDMSPEPPAGSASVKERKAMLLKKSTDTSNLTPPSRQRPDTAVTASHTPPPPPEIVDAPSDFNNTLNIQKTVNLLTTHKIAIADMVEVSNLLRRHKG
jgi:hypothetical protein